MRVLHVIPSVAQKYGGPSQALMGLATAQHCCGMSVTVMIDDPLEQSAGESGLRTEGISIVNLRRAGGQARNRPDRHRMLSEVVRQSDIVHMHGVWAGIFYEAARAAVDHRVPYVIRSCGMLDEWSLRRKWLKKKLYLLLRFGECIRRASALHCTTEMEALSTARAGIRAQQVIVEPNGVAVEDFTAMPHPGEFRHSFGIGEKPLVVFLGRVHPGKGVEYLLPALEITFTTGIAVAIVGPNDSEFGREMIRRAEALKSKCEVIFTGMLAGKERLPPLADADVFVLPSEHENFGVAVVEALAAGCPVVVSDHVGLAKEIERRNVGTVTTLAPADIAGALDGWLARAGQDAEGRARRRAYALATFDWNNIAARWRGHYQRLTA